MPLKENDSLADLLKVKSDSLEPKKIVLPTQQFYNISKKNSKRELDAFSLHKYPGNFSTSYVHDEDFTQTFDNRLS